MSNIKLVNFIFLVEKSDLQGSDSGMRIILQRASLAGLFLVLLPLHFVA